jgi:DNA modification methylase
VSDPQQDGPRQRRALSNLGGPIRTRGEPELAAALGRAWERASSEEPDALTHGFHSWPGRMHWAVARSVFELLRPETVIDPFSGGGTVLVEARVAGAKSMGVDLNPLARRVAEIKTDSRNAQGRAQLLREARAVAERSLERVQGRMPMHVDLPREETEWFAPHVLKELGGLLEEIRALEDPKDRRALEVVVSSILIKVSRQRADTAEVEAERRIRKGLTTELFVRKAEELVSRLDALAQVARAPLPILLDGDARELPRLARGRRCDLVLTSPPYGGTYDYAQHHARRIAWLGLDDRKLRRHELGARRALTGPDARARWDEEVDAMLAAMAEVLTPGGHAVLVMGDAQIGGERVRAPAQLAHLGRRHGLVPTALASQRRTDRTGGRPRAEHIALLRRA